MDMPLVPATPVPLLQWDNVSFGYQRDEPLFQGVSFTIQRGEMVSLLGPNGAGKTSLIRLTSGTVSPTSGSIFLNGKLLGDLSRRTTARAIAVVPQEVTMPFAYTVRQMIELGRTPHLQTFSWGMLGHDDRYHVDRALTLTKTADMADRLFNELSGGERQRVLVAMALSQNPDLLLLDEPTAHLDVRHQLEVLELISHLNRETGLTVLASLHDLNLAARYFPRLLLFQRGIVADGPPSSTLDPALLEQVYHVRVHVGIMRGSRHFSIAAPGEDVTARGLPVRPRVHVVAGGGTGDLVMRALTEADIPFTAGALNIGDSDMTLAERLAVTVITEAPFAAIGPQARRATLAAMRDAGQVIICPIPLGQGNIALLAATRQAMMDGTRVMLFEPTWVSDPNADQSLTLKEILRTRDYADGAGIAAYLELLTLGAIIVSDSVTLIQQCHLYATGSRV